MRQDQRLMRLGGVGSDKRGGSRVVVGPRHSVDRPHNSGAKGRALISGTERAVLCRELRQMVAAVDRLFGRFLEAGCNALFPPSSAQAATAAATAGGVVDRVPGDGAFSQAPLSNVTVSVRVCFTAASALAAAGFPFFSIDGREPPARSVALPSSDGDNWRNYWSPVAGPTTPLLKGLLTSAGAIHSGFASALRRSAAGVEGSPSGGPFHGADSAGGRVVVADLARRVTNSAVPASLTLPAAHPTADTSQKVEGVGRPIPNCFALPPRVVTEVVDMTSTCRRGGCRESPSTLSSGEKRRR